MTGNDRTACLVLVNAPAGASQATAEVVSTHGAGEAPALRSLAVGTS